MRPLSTALAALVGVGLLATPAHAAEFIILTESGSKIVGKLEAKSIKIAGTDFGDLTIDIANIKSIEFGDPLDTITTTTGAIKGKVEGKEFALVTDLGTIKVARDKIRTIALSADAASSAPKPSVDDPSDATGPPALSKAELLKLKPEDDHPVDLAMSAAHAHALAGNIDTAVGFLHVVQANVDDPKPFKIMEASLLLAKAKYVETDSERAWMMRQAAELGHAAGMFQLGQLYETGQGVKKDYTEALRWYKQAAELGHAAGMFELGHFYETGQGVNKDDAEAMKWYKKAAELGRSDAMYRCGRLYHEGRGIRKDHDEALRWYRMAADAGDRNSLRPLAKIYATGRDQVEAVKWYRKAAKFGDAEAMCQIGLHYDLGIGVEKDHGEAMKWYRKALDLGNPEGMICIGDVYDYGRGVKEDYAEAMKWYRKAADLGYARGMLKVGFLYNWGDGTRRSSLGRSYVRRGRIEWAGEVNANYAEAMKWYRKAAELGDAEAMAEIGSLYELGRGVEKDYLEAMAWYRRAMDLGDYTAKRRYDRAKKAYEQLNNR